MQPPAAAALDDQEGEVSKSVKSATPDQFRRLHTPAGRSQSDQISGGKRSAGKKHKQLDLQRFSAYTQRPGDPNTKFSDVNEVVMKGQSMFDCFVLN